MATSLASTSAAGIVRPAALSAAVSHESVTVSSHQSVVRTTAFTGRRLTEWGSHVARGSASVRRHCHQGPIAGFGDAAHHATGVSKQQRRTTKSSTLSHSVACRSAGLEAVADPVAETNGAVNGATSGATNGVVFGASNGAATDDATNGAPDGASNGAATLGEPESFANALGEVTIDVDIAEGAFGAASAEASLVDLTANGGVAEEMSYYEPAYQLLAASKMIPHPAKVDKGGEDAVLISDVGAGVIAVTDGVGGWAEDGVDPALYSNEFIKHLNGIVEAAEDQSELEPRQLLRNAHARTKAPGAATAIVAVFDGESSVLNVASLGDAGVRVVRNGVVVHRTIPREHFFDCPFQFGSESSDSADEAEVVSFPVQVGDTVVMASDGLFDNVFDKDLASIVKVFGGGSAACVSRTATALATLAAKHASDGEYMAPYTLEALAHGKDVPMWQKMMGKKYSGGKLDDISVIVAQVVSTEVAAQAAAEIGAAEAAQAEEATDSETSITVSSEA